jgi:hypothetical protein
MIIHTVAFSLKHAPGSPEEHDFLRSAMVLAEIPGVEHFEQRRQVSPKTDFAFGFSMTFADAAAYAAYDAHPLHAGFVAERWVPEVTRFMELDYEAL